MFPRVKSGPIPVHVRWENHCYHQFRTTSWQGRDPGLRSLYDVFLHCNLLTHPSANLLTQSTTGVDEGMEILVWVYKTMAHCGTRSWFQLPAHHRNPLQKVESRLWWLPSGVATSRHVDGSWSTRQTSATHSNLDKMVPFACSQKNISKQPNPAFAPVLKRFRPLEEELRSSRLVIGILGC